MLHKTSRSDFHAVDSKEDNIIGQLESNLNKKKRSPSRRINTGINLLMVSAARPAIILAISIFLFIVYYVLVAVPADLAKLSSTFWYFVQAMSILISVVVSFNTFILNNEMKNLPSDTTLIRNEDNKVRKILASIASYSYYKNSKLSSTLAMYYSIKITMENAKKIIAATNQLIGDDNNIKSISHDFVNEANYVLSLFIHTKNLYSLATISSQYLTTASQFIANKNSSNIAPNTNTEQGSRLVNDFQESLLRLHALRNLCINISIRQFITKLSYEMFLSAIPIIMFIAALSSIGSFFHYNIEILRIFYSIGFSLVFIPFQFLLFRTIPVVHLASDNSSTPFPYR
jgi:hypothetical protein